MAEQNDRLNKKDLVETIMLVSYIIDFTLLFFLLLMVFNLEFFAYCLPFISVILITDAFLILYLFYHRKIVHTIEKTYYKKLLRKLKKIRNRVE